MDIHTVILYWKGGGTASKNLLIHFKTNPGKWYCRKEPPVSSAQYLIQDYIIHLRIEYAKELLTKEGYTVAETCQHVGYGNISYFIKLFRETTGLTPAQYKRGVDAS